jgi:hypothetical protein
MKVILRSSSLLFTLLGITANARVSKVETALRRGVAGRARIGMTREELLAEFDETAVESADGANIELHFGSDHGEPALVAAMDGGVVRRITVYSPRFRTDKIAGVGTRLRRLALAYELKWREAACADVDELKMRFKMRGERVVSITLS